MSTLSQYLGMLVDIEISGDKKHTGVLADIGKDIMVLYNGTQFLYIPLLHMQNLKLNLKNDGDISAPAYAPIEDENEISYRKILNNAKGIFVEVFVAGNQSIHGYVTNIMTNYFVFYSPVYKTMFIPLVHLKWLIPYNSNQTPYSLDNKFLPVNPFDITLSRTFEEQLKKLEGKIVVFDMGIISNKIGLIKKFENNIIELITAEDKKLYWNVQHLKTVHSPYI